MSTWPLFDAPAPEAGLADKTMLCKTTLCWSVHLLRRQPQRLPRLCAVFAGVSILSVCCFHSLWLALLPVLALAFSLSEYLFPVHYTLTEQSARCRHGMTALEIRWADVRRAYLTDEGIKLSPLRAKNSRFEPLRGVYLRFDDANKEAIMEAVRQHLPKDGYR